MQATPIAEMDAVLVCMPAAARVVMTPHRAAVALCSCVLSAGLVCTLQCTVQYTGRPPTVLLSATIQYTFTHIDRQVGERDMILYHQNHQFLTVSVISISESISSDKCEVPVVLLASDDQLGELLCGDAPVGDLQLLNIVAASQYPLHSAHTHGDPEKTVNLTCYDLLIYSYLTPLEKPPSETEMLMVLRYFIGLN